MRKHHRLKAEGDGDKQRAILNQELRMYTQLTDFIFYRGSPLLIRASGTVFEPIQDGAYVQIVVKYGLIRLLSTKADLCEQVENVDLKCPIEKGVLSLTKSVEIPKEVPPVCSQPRAPSVRRCAFN